MSLTVVTGATGGIGRATALDLAARGHQVVAVARSEPLLNELCSLADNLTPFRCDVSDESQVRKLGGFLHEQDQVPTGLVNAAAAEARTQKAETISLATWRAAFVTDVDGLFLVSREVGTQMIAAGFGRVVNLSSFHTSGTYPMRATYAAAKSAVEGLTRALAVEWGGRGVTLNAVAPGPILTPRTQYFIDDDPHAEAGMRHRTPTGRLGTLQDVVGVVSFLLEPNSGHVNGQVITVDGGWSRNGWWGKLPFNPE